MSKRIYLDYAATSPMVAEAREAMAPWLDRSFGNPSSIYAEGREAKQAIDTARDAVSSALGCRFGEVTFTSGGTESANAALIGKVAFPGELLPLSTVTATFVMHMAGYLAVLLVLQLMGTDIHWLGLLGAIPVLLFMFIFASGLALLTSALQVFVRDVAQILPPLMTFWFFTTPILYSSSLLPEKWANLIKLNPMTWYVERLRDFLLLGNYHWSVSDLLVPSFSILVLWASLVFFRRCSGHFEDFL